VAGCHEATRLKAQAEAYGRFAEEPTRPELERFFFLDDVDRDLIALRRTKHHQLGFALQMCARRYVGLFLEDPLAGVDARRGAAGAVQPGGGLA
jgi:hypothetical protein